MPFHTKAKKAKAAPKKKKRKLKAKKGSLLSRISGRSSRFDVEGRD